MSRIKSEKLGQDLSIVFTQQNNVEGKITYNENLKRFER